MPTEMTFKNRDQKNPSGLYDDIYVLKQSIYKDDSLILMKVNLTLITYRLDYFDNVSLFKAINET